MEGTTTTVHPRSRGLLATSLLVAIICSMFTGLLASSASASVRSAHSQGSSAVVGALFGCDGLSVTVTSTKDLSNVVLVLTDGTHVKHDGLSGLAGTFSANQAITGVYIKSGNNGSGAGPGYGEHVPFVCSEPVEAPAPPAMDIIEEDPDVAAA